MSNSSSRGEHLPVQFSAYPGSYGLLSEARETKAAIVFVHGFLGDAQDTWQEFQRLIDAQKFGDKFQKVDLFFYDYPSQLHSIKNAAEELEKFVDRMLRDGPWSAALDGVTLPGLHAPVDPDSPEQYDDVLLVGHSLGGVLVRKLITIAADGGAPPDDGADWPTLLRRQPRLFAPAHSGFRQGDLVSLLAAHSKIAAIIIGYWRYRRAKVYAELQPGNPSLVGLKDRTLALRGQQPGCPALYATVIWGVNENVVFDEDYPGDNTLKSVEGKDHQSICKPTDDFDDPLEFLIHGLE